MPLMELHALITPKGVQALRDMATTVKSSATRTATACQTLHKCWYAEKDNLGQFQDTYTDMIMALKEPALDSSGIMDKMAEKLNELANEIEDYLNTGGPQNNVANFQNYQDNNTGPTHGTLEKKKQH